MAALRYRPHTGRIAETFDRSRLAIDNAPKIWANAIAPALIRIVAGAALVEHALPSLSILGKGWCGDGKTRQQGGRKDKATHLSRLLKDERATRRIIATSAAEIRHDANGRLWQTRKGSCRPHFRAFIFLQ
jgi:hypothetical protein